MAYGSESIFVVLSMNDGQQVGYAFTTDVNKINQAPPSDDAKKENVTPAGEATTFKEVFNSLASVIETYRNFLEFTIKLAPFVSKWLAEYRLGDFARKNGKKRDDLSSPDKDVFEVSLDTWRELMVTRYDAS